MERAEVDEPGAVITSKACPDAPCAVDETPYDCLKGYEEELMGLLDLFSRSDQDSSSATHFGSLVCGSSEDFDDELNGLPVPDLMNEGASSWTEFLMDDFPNDKLLPLPVFDSSQLPGDFLAISMSPQETSNCMQPSLPASMFPMTPDESAFPGHDTAQLNCPGAEQPLESDVPHMHTDVPHMQTTEAVSASQPSLGAHNSLVSQASSSSITEMVCQILPAAHDATQAAAPEVQPPLQQGSYPSETQMVPVPGQATSTESPHLQPPVTESPPLQPQSEQASNGKKKAVKRRRASKPKDPNAPKRGRGRPRVDYSINCLKHMKAFEEDGGFTLGDKAQLLLTGNQADLEAVAEQLKQPQPNETSSQNA